VAISANCRAKYGDQMTDHAAPQARSPPELITIPGEGKFSKLLGRLKRVKGVIAAIAGAGAVVGGLTGYWNAYQATRITVPAPTASSTTASAGPLSIAVLPFANLTGDANQAYVADGLTASLTSDLSRIRDAFIVNASTAYAYKDKPVIAMQVGKDLGVHFILQGSVQRSGTKIRVTAQLADATSNAQLWSESVEGDESDLFALQDRVTRRIGNSIGREMVIIAARESETRKSNPKAVDLMLRARALDLKPQSLINLRQTEAWYRKVLVLEPNNVTAMVGLARSLTLQAYNFGTALDESIVEKKYVEGYDLALKVKELDPDNPGVYSPIGLYALSHGDFAGNQRANETRLSLEPKNPAAYNNLALSFINGGEPKRAIELLAQGINMEPNHPNETTLHNMGRAYFDLGDNDASIEWHLKTLEVNPAHSTAYAYLAMAYMLKGDDAKARAATSNMRRGNPNFRLPVRLKPVSSSPIAYKEYYERKFLPAWRMAGLPE